MEDKPKRPRLVGILQIILVLYGLSNSLLLLGFLISSIGGNPYPMPLYSPFNLVRALFAATLFLTAATGMARRRNVGRWLAAASFFFIATLDSYSMFSVALNPDPGFELLSKNEIIIINAVWIIVFAGATFYLMFSTKVFEYFNPPIDNRISEPPPPPSFDS